MKFIKRYQLTKQKPLKGKKEVKPATARKLFLGGLVVLIGCIPITYIKAQNSLLKAEKVEVSAKKLVAQAKNQANKQSVPTSPLFEQWVEPFVGQWVNLPTNPDGLDARQKALEGYVAYTLPDAKNTGVTQTLLSKNLYDVQKKDSYTVAVYDITYRIQTPVEKERKVKKNKNDVVEKYIAYDKKDVSILLNIPFKEFDGSFKVMSAPYYSSKQALTKKQVEPLEKDTDVTSASSTESEAIQKFVRDFMDKYASGSKKDMAYLMNQPEVLNGEYDVSTVKTDVAKKANKYVALVTYQLKDKETKMTHEETMSLLIQKQEKNYFVQKLSHDLGGFKND